MNSGVTDIATRAWCALVQYPGRKNIRVGTLTMPVAAQHHEIEAAFTAKALEYLPAGFKIVTLTPGAVFFVPG